MSESATPPRASEPGYLGLAAALALLAHGGWFYFYARPWTPETSPAAVVEAPRLTYLAAAQHSAIQEERLLGSPVLFALPSPQGFSGKNPAALSVTPSSMRAAGGESLLLARSDVPAPSPDFLRPLAQTVAQPGELEFSGVEPRAEVGRPGSTGFAVRVYWPDGAPSVRSGLPGAGVLAPVLKDRPWDLVALLEFDEQGGVRHVFLEKPTADRERNEFLARTLRGLRIDPAGAQTWARLALQYEQDSASRILGAGANRP